MSGLKEIIIKKIKESPEQSISFADYMSLCLYHSEYGYYQQEKQKIGKKGDFYTSSSVHPVFAETFADLAVQYFNAEEELRQSRGYTFIEMGAGTGAFAQQFMHYLSEQYPATAEKLTYIIIEKSAYHIELQQVNLAAYPQVTWIESVKDMNQEHIINPMIFFSNELLDAFPVYLVQWNGTEVQEVRVGVQSDELIEVTTPLISTEVKEFLASQPLELKAGQRRELTLAIADWVAEVNDALREALWLTVDYGIIANEDWLHPAYKRGTIRCFYNHQVDQKPLERPGDKDITYHVPFPELIKDFERHGWSELFLLRQDRFLLEAGILHKLSDQNYKQSDPFSDQMAKRNRAIRHLLSPEGISGSMYILAVYKGGLEKNSLQSKLLPFSLDQMLNMK